MLRGALHVVVGRSGPTPEDPCRSGVVPMPVRVAFSVARNNRSSPDAMLHADAHVQGFDLMPPQLVGGYDMMPSPFAFEGRCARKSFNNAAGVSAGLGSRGRTSPACGDRTRGGVQGVYVGVGVGRPPVSG